MFHDWADGRAILVEAGSKATGQTADATNVDQLLDAGLQERADVAQEGRRSPPTRATHPTRTATPVAATRSVSKARSDVRQVDAVKQTPSPAFLSGLPANQKCG